MKKLSVVAKILPRRFYCSPVKHRMLSIRTRIRQLLECLASRILPKEDLADDKSSLTDKNLNSCMRDGITNCIPDYTSLLRGVVLS